MSQLQKYQNKLQRDKIEIKKKPIYKPRKKNQYSVEFQFESTENLKLVKRTLIIQSILPRELALRIPFRLQSDLQIPQYFQSQQSKLGELQVDLFSANYKVTSFQTRKNLILLNLEPFDFDYTDFSLVEQFFKKNYPSICESVAEFQSKQSESIRPQLTNFNKYQDLQQLEAYTNAFPLSGYISRVKNGCRQTITKFMNSLMLDYMQITLEMMKDYISETKVIPYPLFYTEHYFDQIDSIYKRHNDSNFQGNLMIEHQNYSGQRMYPKMCKYKKLIIQESQNSFLEYYFYWIEDFKQNINREQIKLNEIEYFNKSQKQHHDSSFINSFWQQQQDVDNLDSEQHLRCGYKNIN